LCTQEVKWGWLNCQPFYFSQENEVV